jgi:hypothetical protein
MRLANLPKTFSEEQLARDPELRARVERRKAEIEAARAELKRRFPETEEAS